MDNKWKRILLYVLSATAFIVIASLFIWEATEEAVRKEKSDTTLVKKLVDLKKGDLVLMNDDRVCLVIQEPRWILGSKSENPETYSTVLSCRPMYHEGDFRVRELARLVRGVAKPSYSNYDILAGDYVRQMIPKAPR